MIYKYTVSQNKTPVQFFCDNFGKYEPILINLSLLHSTMNCRRSYYIIRHLTSNLIVIQFISVTDHLFTVNIYRNVMFWIMSVSINYFRRLASGESIVVVGVCLYVCVSVCLSIHPTSTTCRSASLFSMAKVMRCIQCSVVYNVTACVQNIHCQQACMFCVVHTTVNGCVNDPLL